MGRTSSAERLALHLDAQGGERLHVDHPEAESGQLASKPQMLAKLSPQNTPDCEKSRIAKKCKPNAKICKTLPVHSPHFDHLAPLVRHPTCHRYEDLRLQKIESAIASR
jgi:hypothetical protein